MEPQELTNEVLLESILECTHFVSQEVPNLFKKNLCLTVTKYSL